MYYTDLTAGSYGIHPSVARILTYKVTTGSTCLTQDMHSAPYQQQK